MVTNALTIDVEEWYHICDAGPHLTPAQWPSLPSRLMIGLEILIEELDRAGARATFFILGDAAARTPECVETIMRGGHEIASHGSIHKQVYRMTPDEFAADLDRSLSLLRDWGAADVRGYRAPEWSIRRDSLWALKILASRGLAYDSSIFPIRVIGMPEARSGVWRTSGENGGPPIVEWTPPVRRLLGENIPFSGGLHLRLLPCRIISKWIADLNRQGTPALVYVHPWELDPDPPRARLSGIKSFVHTAGIGTTREKLRRLLADFSFAPIDTLLNTMDRDSLPEGP